MKKFVELDFKIQELNESDNFAEFKIEPLVQGFATTLGNSLRRVLLSSILGASVYAYQIEGIEQEFQVLPGCEENITDISLNVQSIIVSVDTNVFQNEKETIVLTLSAKGPQKVFARDIKAPAGVEIINGNQEILTIVKNNKTVNMKFLVIQGRGFSNFQDNKELTNSDIGYITVTSNFSPVKKVAFKVEEIKIGQQDVSEQLIIGVQTNGILTPAICLARAAQILVAHLNYFVKLKEGLPQFAFQQSNEQWENTPKLEVMNLDFSERTTNALRSAGINYLTDLTKKKKSELLKIKNLGQVSLKEIVDKLQDEFKIQLEE